MSVFERHPKTTAVMATMLIGIVAVVLLEVLLTLTRPAEQSLLGREPSQRYLSFREYPPGRRFWTMPSDPASVYPGGLENRRYVLETDADGFLVPSQVHASPAFEIAFLGGSTTEGLFVTPEQRFPYLVGRILEDSLGQPVNTLNGGRSGNHSLHAALAFQAKVAPRRPRYVVLMENVNDLVTLAYYGSYWSADGRSVLVDASDLDAQQLPVARRLKLVVGHLAPNVVAATQRLRLMIAGADELGAARRAARPDTALVIGSFRRSLRSWVGMVRGWEVTPVLMTQANRFTPTLEPALADQWTRAGSAMAYEDFRTLYRRLNDVVREVATAEGVPLIDLDQQIRPDRLLMYDAVHFTDAGSRVAAAAVADAFIALERQASRSPTIGR